MDHACFVMDTMLAAFLPTWREAGYEVIVTPTMATDRGHHGGNEDDQRNFALYHFGAGYGPDSDAVLDQLQLAPTILTRLGVTLPGTMLGEAFLL